MYIIKIKVKTLRSQPMNKNKKFLVATAVVVIAISFMLFSGFKSEGVYYLTVGEVLHNPEKLKGKTPCL